MFARASTYQLPAGRSAAAEQEFRGAIARIADLDGLEDAYLLISEDGDQALTVTVWDTHDAMVASRVTASVARRAAAEAVGGGVTSTVEYRVAVRVSRADATI
jgi:heme-degrading monooxygenase HmoA